MEVLKILFTKTWWTWDPRDDQWFSVGYHWFNNFKELRGSYSPGLCFYGI